MSSKLGEFDVADSYLTEAQHLDEALGDVYGRAATLLGLGVIARARGNEEGALELFKEALEGARRTGARHLEAVLHLNIGTVVMELGRSAHALEKYERALELFFELGEKAEEIGALMNLSALLSQLGEIERAEEHLERAFRKNEELGGTEKPLLEVIERPQQFQATQLLREGKLREAAPLLDQLLEQTPADDDLLLMSAYCHAELGELDDAEARLTRLSPSRQSSVDALVVRSVLAEKRGDVDGAVTTLRNIVKLEPTKTELVPRLAVLLRRQRRYGELLEVLEQWRERTTEDSRRSSSPSQSRSHTSVSSGLGSCRRSSKETRAAPTTSR